MDIKVKNIRAYGKGCIGCQNTGTDIMISYMPENSDQIIDLFLTQEQAEAFQPELCQALVRNLVE